MKIKTLLAILLLGLGFGAVADGVVISQAYEVLLSDFRPPATANGGASFKTCMECERQLVRVTAGTRYSVNGQQVRLQDFREVVMAANDRDQVALTVLHHLESDTILSIAVYL